MKTNRCWWFCRWTYLRGVWENIQQLCYLPKRFYQRARYGVCYADIWNFDAYLAKVIANGARMLKDAHTYPGYDEADTPEKWCDILEEIARRAEDYLEEPWEDYYDEKLEGAKSKEETKELLLEMYGMEKSNYNRLMELLTKWFPHMWD